MIPRRNTVRASIEKFEDGRLQSQPDILAAEEPLEIRLVHESGGKRSDTAISITMRTPGDDFELAAGFLFGEAIVKNRDDIREISYCVGKNSGAQEYNVVSVKLSPECRFDAGRLARNFYTTSSCGVCGKASIEALNAIGSAHVPPGGISVSAQTLQSLGGKLRERQSLFDKTGGLHAAALFDAAGTLVSVREDVGRHNAVDKLIGEQFLAGNVPLRERLLLVSGRASFELVQKALAAGISLMAAVGAPSSLAVELAREGGMTLVGFLKPERFNVYCGAERIQIGGP